MSKKILFISFVVSLGGFLFGFDAGIISGVMSYVNPQFNLTDIQSGWVVSSPSFAAMFTMLISGKLSDKFGRKNLLIFVAFLYALSAILSAIAFSYEMLYIARMIGGIAFGAALVLAPMYIAEIATAKNRGKLVAIQQLNIVIGFFTAFLSNYFFNKYNTEASTILTDETVWRWMLGVEFFPAILYFIFLFFIPKSPRWVYLTRDIEQTQAILKSVHGAEVAAKEFKAIVSTSENEEQKEKPSFWNLVKPPLRFIFLVGLLLGILQQITGINAVYFYATSIFKQTGIGNDAAFSSGILLSTIALVFTLVSMYLIDRAGRRILLLTGTLGIALSLLLCAYSFNKATYTLTSKSIEKLAFKEAVLLQNIVDKTYTSDVAFKSDVKKSIGYQVFAKNDGAILEAATTINATLVLIGILGFVACFAFSLGPVMWVLLSEIFPLKYRGLAIGIIVFFNSLVSSIVQLIFPWELSNIGNAFTFFIFGAIALLGFFAMIKLVPETKGKSLEEIEKQFTMS